MANETPSRPPPLMANAIKNFHFDFPHTSLMLTTEKNQILAQNAVNHSRRDIAWRCMKECTLEKDASRVTDVFFTKLQFENS